MQHHQLCHAYSVRTYFKLLNVWTVLRAMYVNSFMSAVMCCMQLTLDSDSQGLLDRIANFVELASNLRNLSALILNRSRQSLQQAMDTRDTVISMLVEIRELYVRFVKQGERIEAGGKAIDDIYADVAARSAGKRSRLARQTAAEQS